MNTFRLSSLALLMSLLFGGQLLAQPLPKREFRGVWISTVTNIDWPASPTSTVQEQKDRLTAILDNVTGAGFNAVIFQVRPECDALYESSIEPWSYWLTGQQGRAPAPWYDPLTFAVEEAHKRGLEIHAWFNPYRAVRDTTIYAVAPNHVSVQHPDWILRSGKLKMLDPGKAAVREYVSRVIADVVRRYDVDGAHMDDYFYTDNMSFTIDANTFATEPRGFSSQADWRRDNVNTLIKQIYDSIQVIKPWVKWGMSPRGIWKNGVPTGIIGSDNYNTIWCDAVAWLQGKYIDYLAPQLYWRIGGSQDYKLLQPWWASQRNGRDLYPGLATYRIGASNFGPASEIANQIRFNRSSGNPQGSIQFTANNITGNLGGIRDTLINDIHKYPALLPVMAWKDTIAPYMPRAIRYAPLAQGTPSKLQWDVPLVAPDGDTASRYVVYRFDHSPNLSTELSDSKNILLVGPSRAITLPVPQGTGPYYFVVTALDRNYNESEPSNIQTINPPLAPLLASPAAGASDLSTTAVLRWFASAQAGSYHVQVSEDSTFAGTLFADLATVPDTMATVNGLVGQHVYFWRVSAANAGGVGGYSAVRSMRIAAPAAPLLASPANLSLNVPQTVVFAWRPAEATSYRFALSGSSDFSTVIVDTAGLVDTTFSVSNLLVNRIHYWRVNATNASGASLWSEVWRFRTVVTSVDETAGLPDRYELSQNYPNPFNPSTTINFALPSGSHVTLKIYSVLGEEIATLVDDYRSPGRYSVVWDSRDTRSGIAAASGVYFYRLTAGSFVTTGRMLLLK